MKDGGSMSTANPTFRRRSRVQWLCALASAAVVAVVAAAGLVRSHAQSWPSHTTVVYVPLPPPANSQVSQAPAAGQQKQQDPVETAMKTQQQQVADEAADLLKLATDLKAAVDKTTKDQLSVGVVRKAGAIEQLAHKVRTGTGKS